MKAKKKSVKKPVKKRATRAVANPDKRAKEEKIRLILSDLESKISEIEDIEGELDGLSKEGMNPEKTKVMLEEIKVPPLEIIQEKPKKS